MAGESLLKDKPFVFSIGLEKCGTTSLHDYLALASNVSAPYPKELEYFNHKYAKGPEWFLSHFAADREIFIDCSPTYHWSGDALRRIASDCNLRVIALLLRNPLQRAYSAYIHQRTWFFADAIKAADYKRFAVTFGQVAEADDRFVFPSYLAAIGRAHSAFGASDVDVITVEALAADPSKYLERFQNRLGTEIKLPRSTPFPRSNRLTMPHFILGSELRALRSAKEVGRIKEESAYMLAAKHIRPIAAATEIDRLRALENKWNEPVEIEILQRIVDKFYSREFETLERFTGSNLESWRQAKAVTGDAPTSPEEWGKRAREWPIYAR